MIYIWNLIILIFFEFEIYNLTLYIEWREEKSKHKYSHWVELVLCELKKNGCPKLDVYIVGGVTLRWVHNYVNRVRTNGKKISIFCHLEMLIK